MADDYEEYDYWNLTSWPSSSSEIMNSDETENPLLQLELLMWHVLSNESLFQSIHSSNLTSLLDPIPVPEILNTLGHSFQCGNNSATFQQLVTYVDISWYLDGVLQVVLKMRYRYLVLNFDIYLINLRTLLFNITFGYDDQ